MMLCESDEIPFTYIPEKFLPHWRFFTMMSLRNSLLDKAERLNVRIGGVVFTTERCIRTQKYLVHARADVLE